MMTGSWSLAPDQPEWPRQSRWPKQGSACLWSIRVQRRAERYTERRYRE